MPAPHTCYYNQTHIVMPYVIVHVPRGPWCRPRPTLITGRALIAATLSAPYGHSILLYVSHRADDARAAARSWQRGVVSVLAPPGLPYDLKSGGCREESATVGPHTLRWSVNSHRAMQSPKITAPTMGSDRHTLWEGARGRNVICEHGRDFYRRPATTKFSRL